MATGKIRKMNPIFLIIRKETKSGFCPQLLQQSEAKSAELINYLNLTFFVNDWQTSQRLNSNYMYYLCLLQPLQRWTNRNIMIVFGVFC